MHPARARRLKLIVLMLVAVGIATGLALFALKENLMFYFTPAEIAGGKAPINQLFRVGGMVVEGSVVKAQDSVDVQFDLTDYDKTIRVKYSDILPDLFREGQGIIAKGRLNDKGVFVAEEVLAKHDETYMPAEVAATIKDKVKNHQPKGTPE